MTTHCCPVGKHPRIVDIDRLIRAQQAASQSGQSTLAMSYSQIARTYDIRKATLLAHRDVCLAQRTGTVPAGVPVRSDGVPGRTAADACGENASDSARSDRYGAGAPALGAKGTDADGGRATGPPGEGPDRHTSMPPAAQSAPTRVAQCDVDVVVDAGSGASSRGMGQRGPVDARAVDASSAEGVDGGVGQPRPPERSRPDARARARDRATTRWDGVGLTSIDAAADRITRVVEDSEATNSRAHATYVQEIIELVDRVEWNNARSVDALTRKWNKPKMYVLGCYRDACMLMRLARGSPNEDREVSLRLWHQLFLTAMEKGDPISLKVAAEARKGYDAAAGIVDKSTRVQVNIAQDPAAQEFVRIVFEEARSDPALLERIRRRLAEARDRIGDPTALLTTGVEIDAAE